MIALAVVGLFAFAVLVGVVTSARRSVHESAAVVEAWNARAERDVWQDPPITRTVCRATNQQPCERCGERPWTTRYLDPWSLSIDAALGRPLHICDECAEEIHADQAALAETRPEGYRDEHGTHGEPSDARIPSEGER